MGIMSVIRKTAEEGKKQAGIKSDTDKNGVFEEKKDSGTKAMDAFSKLTHISPPASMGTHARAREEWIQTLRPEDREFLKRRSSGEALGGSARARRLENDFKMYKAVAECREEGVKIAEKYKEDSTAVEFLSKAYESGKAFNELTVEDQKKCRRGIDILKDVENRIKQADKDYAELDKMSDDELERLLVEKTNGTKTGSYSDRAVCGYVVGKINEVKAVRYEKEKNNIIFEGLGGYDAKAEREAAMGKPLSNEEFIALEKEEYDGVRLRNPSLPEFGSYEYFIRRAEQIAPLIDTTKMDNALFWSSAGGRNPNDPRARNMYMNIDRYIPVMKAVDFLGHKGVHLNGDGSVDASAGKRQAEKEDELWGVLKTATDAGHLKMFSEAGLLTATGQHEYDDYANASEHHDIAEDVIKAYEYYEKYKDKAYDDNLLGWVSGGWRLGVTDLKRGDAGETLYHHKSTDTEATDLYKMLSGEIVENSGSTFDEGGFWKNNVLAISQYAPQGLRQAGTYGAGYALGAFFSNGNKKAASAVANLFSSADMYGQTAGQAYLANLEAGLSAEDAYIMATDEAAWSAVTEFLVGVAVDLVGNGIVGKVFKTTVDFANPGKLVGYLMKKGMTHQGANRVVEAGYKTADFLLSNIGEGTEEFLQEGLSITAQRYAKEGKTVSALELLEESFNFSKYTDEEFKQMGDSFKTGFVIGSFTTGVKKIGNRILGNPKAEAALRAVKNTDAAYFGEAVLKLDNSADVLNAAVTMGKESKQSSTSKLANTLGTALAKGEAVSAKDAGTLTKNLLLEGKNVFATTTLSLGAVEAGRKGDDFDRIVNMGKGTDEVMYQVKDEDGNVVNKSLKSDGKSGKINNKDSKQSGVMWTMADGVLDNREVAAFYSKISEMKKQGYKNFNRTTDGEYIFEINNKLVVTDGKYMKPTITDVFTFESENETINAIAREAFYEQTQSGRTVRDAQSFVEIVYGEGFIKRNDIEDSGSYAQMRNGRRKGSAGAEVDSRGGKNVSDFDKLVAMGTNEYAESARAKIEETENGEDTDVLTSVEEKPKGNTSGVTLADILSGNIPEALQARLESFKKVISRLGFTVVYESHRETPKNTIGYVDFANREVYLSPEHIDEALLTHELTHIIDKGFSGKYVQSLTSFFKKHLSAEWDKKYNEVKTKYEGIAKKNEGFTYTDSTLEAETLAEMCAEFSTDEYLKKAANMEVGTIRQVIVMFNYVRAKLKSIFMDTSSEQKFKVASLKWQLALYKATKKGVNNNGSGVVYSGSSAKYDYRKSFDEQIEDYKNGVFPENDSLLLGGTPEVWRKAGFNALPVTINQTHVDYAINGTKDADHYIGEAMLKQLPEAIKNPVAIIQSVTHPDRAVVVLRLQHNGKSVILPVEIDGYARTNNIVIDSNAIASVLGKNNAVAQLADAVTHTVNGSKELFYWNKKEALSLLQRGRHQLPTALPQDGFIYSIRENGSKVKVKLENVTESQQFKRWFGKSKVVDENGVPKVVYHGTSRGGFSEFDTYAYLARYGLFGNGAYFTEDRSVAEEYSHKGKGANNQVYEVYLSIKKPLDMDAVADVKKWNAALEREDIRIDIPEGSTNENVLRLVEEELSDMDIPHYEGEEIVRNIFETMGYDGLTHIGGGRVNPDGVRHRVWIAFHPEQIKSVDNVGTFDGDNPNINFSVADDEDSAGDSDIETVYDSLSEDSGAEGAESSEVAELEESISLISEALENEELSRTDRVALFTERTKHRKRLAEIKGDTDEGKVSRRKAVLDEYNETGDPAVLPSEERLKASDRYDKKRIAEIRQEFAQIQETLRNDNEMTAYDRDELISRKEALTTQLQRIADDNSVLSEIKDIVDGFGTGEHISHEWVNDVSADLSDPTVGGMVRQGVYNTNDVERNFKRFFGKHYGEAYEKVLKPFYESKKAYAEDVVKYAKLIREEVVKKLGIKEGTKESAAVMWLGEGERTLTQKELVADLGKVGARRLRKQIKKGEVSEQFAEYTYEDCVKEFGKEKSDNILAATKVFRKCYDELIAEINKVRAEIYPNNPDKLINKRADYFRHFNEISSSIKGLRAAMENNQGIDPMLVGLSEHTSPKSKWQSFEQKRTGNKTTYDAVGGFLDYLMSAEYAIHIDKNIVNFRSLARDLALAKSEEAAGAGNPNANGFIRYLQRFANHLAGKTVSTLDRAIADMPHGRQMIAVLNWVNNRAKANAVLGNMSSVVAQVSNIKNAVGKIDKTWYLWKGAAQTFGGMFGKDSEISRRYNESGFLKERFMGDELRGFETSWSKVWHAPKNFAAWVLGLADEVGTRITYNAAYNQAKARKLSNPAEYADSFTRSCVAGRGIGDVPLVLQSQVAKLFMPFRVEVLNDMNARADMLWGSDYWQKQDKGKKADAIGVDEDTISNDSSLVNKMKYIVDEIKKTPEIFNVTADVLEPYKNFEKKSDRIYEYFKSIGGSVIHPELGKIELNKSGAKATINHGFGDRKLLAVGAIKNILEKGKVVEHQENWKGKGFDTYVIVGRGNIVEGKRSVPCSVGVIVKAYPGGDFNSKFYLHEVVEIKNEKGYPSAMAADNGVTHGGNPSLETIISQDEGKSNSDVSGKTDDFDRIISMGSQAGDGKVKLYKRMGRYVRFLVFCSVMNALIAALKGDGFSPIDDIEEGFEEAEEEGKEGMDKILAGMGNSAGNLWGDYIDGYGDGVAYDPLGGIAQGIYEGMSEGENAKDDVTMSVMRSFQNLFGDYISNNPFASAAIAVTGADEDVLDKITNGKLYTPAGAGSPVFSTLWTTAKELVDGDYTTAGKEVVTDFLLPWGGSQVDKTIRGAHEYGTGYATTENAYERMAGKGGKLKYLIKPNQENFIKSLLFGPASFSEANDYYYTDDPYKLSEDDTKEVLKEKDYKGRKTKFDEIVGWKRYEDERKEALDKMEADYYGDKKDSALYSILYYTDDKGEKQRWDNAIPYGRFNSGISITVDKRKVKGKISVEKAKEMNAFMGERLEQWYDMLNESAEFSQLDDESKKEIVSAIYSMENDYMVVNELHRQGLVSDYEYENFEFDYVIKCAEKLTDLDASIYTQATDSALSEWVNDRGNADKLVKYNAAYSAMKFLDDAYFMDDEIKAEVKRYYEHESERAADDVDTELARLSYETRDEINVYGDIYGIISYTKNGVKYAVQIPADKIYDVFSAADTQTRRKLSVLFKKSSYINATDEEKVKMINSVRSDVRGDLRKRYKASYPSVRVEDAFDRTMDDDVEGAIDAYYETEGGVPDEVDSELDRLSESTKSEIDVFGSPYDIMSYTENGVDYAIQVPSSDVYNVFEDFDTQVRGELSSLFKSSSYADASDTGKKKMIVSVRNKVRNRIRSSIRLKYPSVKMGTLFDRIVEMKSK